LAGFVFEDFWLGWHLQKLFHFAAASISSDQGLIGKIVNALPDTATHGSATSEGGIDEWEI